MLHQADAWLGQKDTSTVGYFCPLQTIRIKVTGTEAQAIGTQLCQLGSHHSLSTGPQLGPS